jgi:hypothetical protein
MSPSASRRATAGVVAAATVLGVLAAAGPAAAAPGASGQPGASLAEPQKVPYAVTEHLFPAAVRPGKSVTVRGTVRPAAPHAVVTLQLRTPGCWRTVRRARLSRRHAISCVAADFCVVAGDIGADYLAGPAVSRISGDSEEDLAADCPSASLCFLGDGGGLLW